MITQATPQLFESSIKNGETMIVDVRTHAEFLAEHIHGAKNFDIASPVFDLNVKTIPKHKILAVYCRNGVRSQVACDKFEKMGFMRIFHLYGGITSWKMMQKPLVVGEER